MNNDIARVNFGHNNVSNKTNASSQTAHAMVMENAIENTSMKDSMTFLGTMGYAQVSMDNLAANKSVRHSVETFMQNPDLIQAHVEFCDELVEKGYCLEEAIQKTDSLFAALKNENIYN